MAERRRGAYRWVPGGRGRPPAFTRPPVQVQNVVVVGFNRARIQVPLETLQRNLEDLTKKLYRRYLPHLLGGQYGLRAVLGRQMAKTRLSHKYGVLGGRTAKRGSIFERTPVPTAGMVENSKTQRQAYLQVRPRQVAPAAGGTLPIQMGVLLGSPTTTHTPTRGGQKLSTLLLLERGRRSAGSIGPRRAKAMRFVGSGASIQANPDFDPVSPRNPMYAKKIGSTLADITEAKRVHHRAIRPKQIGRQVWTRQMRDTVREILGRTVHEVLKDNTRKVKYEFTVKTYVTPVTEGQQVPRSEYQGTTAAMRRSVAQRLEAEREYIAREMGMAMEASEKFHGGGTSLSSLEAERNFILRQGRNQRRGSAPRTTRPAKEPARERQERQQKVQQEVQKKDQEAQAVKKQAVQNINQAKQWRDRSVSQLRQSTEKAVFFRGDPSRMGDPDYAKQTQAMNQKGKAHMAQQIDAIEKMAADTEDDMVAIMNAVDEYRALLKKYAQGV